MNSSHWMTLLSSLWCLGLMLPGCAEPPAPRLGPPCSQHDECPEAPASFCAPDSKRCTLLCSQDADCPGQACRNGQCVAPPSAEAAASCKLVPDFVLGRVGMRVHFTLLATDAAGEPLVPGEGISWTTASEAVTGGGEGIHAAFTLTAPTQDTEAVEARLGSTVCRARVTVLPAGVPPGQVRVIVTDELTGRPLPGALVAVSDSAGDIQASSETDAYGVAWLPAAGVVSLNVFHSDYSYLTLAHYDTQRGTRDVLLPLCRTSYDRAGGSRGTFVNVPTSENILFGVSGLSIPGLVFYAREKGMLGPSVPVHTSLPGKPTLKVPSGTSLTLGSQVLKSDYSAFGVAGVCDAELLGVLDPKEAIRSGTCGTRTSWAISGELPLAGLTSDGFDPRASALQLLFQNSNQHRHFYSSVKRDIQFPLKPLSASALDHLVNVDTAHHTQVDHDFRQLPLGFQFALLLPPPPPSSPPLDTLSVMATVDVPGQGTTLLGLGSAPVEDALRTTHAVRVNMAPAHHGLEGNPYRFFVIAHTRDAWNIAKAGDMMSALAFVRDGLPADPRTSSPIKPSGEFLPVPKNGYFNFNLTPYQGLQGREFRFLKAPGLDEATLVNLSFESRDSYWVVWMDASRATTGIRLPIPPSPFRDRTRGYYSPTDRTHLDIQAISARKRDGGKLDLMVLAEAADANLANLGDFVVAFSAHSHGIPNFRWLNLAGSPGIPSIDHDSEVVVQANDFRINPDPADDGHVQLSFQGGTGCESERIVQELQANGSEGAVRFQLPKGCRGTLVKMTATLVDSQQVPLSPRVSTDITVNII